MSGRRRPAADDMALAERLVRYGRRCGADEIEVGIGEADEFDVSIRKGEIESLVEAGSRYAGIRVIKDKKTAHASSSDMAEKSLRRLIRGAVRRAEFAQSDEFAGLAEFQNAGVDLRSLDLDDAEVRRIEPKAKIDLARRTERIALADRRITNSHGAGFGTTDALSVLVSSNGFAGSYRKTSAGLSVGLQAGDTDDLAEDDWGSSQVHIADLETAEQVARTAVARTVRLLRPRKIKTQRVPVIFEPLMTGSLLGFLFGCISGTSVYQRTTFLADKLGQAVADERITIVDDGLMPRRLGSSPFDDEGLPTRRTAVIERGILRNFLTNAYAARRLGLPLTANADGGGVGPNNFYLQPGPHPPADIVRGCRRAFLLVRTLGHGLNPVTGDISRGAFGLWIENGEIAYPVSEVTISGNLGDILRNIEMVGNDLEFRGSICGPTIKVAEMLIAGE